jgi:hypothetical protein
MANIHEIDLTLKDIEAHPEDHEQGSWAIRKSGTTCGTAMCAAGFTVVRHGYKLLFSYRPSRNQSCIPSNQAEHCQAPDGKVESIPAAARRILGLSVDWADYFFSADNDLQDLHEIRDAIAAQSGEL